MTLAKQCDEIVRLIDRTLRDVALCDDGTSLKETDAIEPEFPEDELGRIHDHERFCVVGRPVRFPDRPRAIIPHDRIRS